MDVQVRRCVNEDEPDDDGSQSYHYEYDLYEFSDSSITFQARSYTDEPDEAHFLSKKTHSRCQPIVEDDLSSDLLVEAVKYLRGVGKKRVRYLAKCDYVDFDPLSGA